MVGAGQAHPDQDEDSAVLHFWSNYAGDGQEHPRDHGDEVGDSGTVCEVQLEDMAASGDEPG